MHKIGLVGVGRWAEKISRTISSMQDEAKIVAICQRTTKEIPWIPSDCKVYDNMSDMLRKETLTHIITAIDPDGHYDVVEKATKYGLPIWLEKPMALSYKEAERIFALDGSIFVDYIHLYSECFDYLCNEVKDSISSGSIIRSVLYSLGPNHKFPVLYDFASHDLSMLLEIFKDIEIKNVSMTTSSRTSSPEASPTTSTLHYSIEMTTDVGCDIYTKIGNDGRSGRARSFSVDTDIHTSYLYDGIGQKVFHNTNEVFAAKELPLKHAIRAFLSGERVDKDKTLKITTLLDEIQERAERGLP